MIQFGYVIAAVVAILLASGGKRKPFLTDAPGGGMRLRGCDAQGCGHFGAPRGTRKHAGLDVECVPGATVHAPWAGTVERTADPYGDGKYSGLLIRIDARTAYKVMYMAPLGGLVGSKVAAGDTIGYAQDISRRYSAGMKPHLHLEVYVDGQAIDPEPLLFA